MSHICVTCCSPDLKQIEFNGVKFEKKVAWATNQIRIYTLWKCTVCTTQHARCMTYDSEGKLMGDNMTTEVPAVVKQQMTRSELLEKLRTLEENKASVTQMKKAASKDYREQLDSLDDELADVLAQLKNTAEKTDVV